MSIIPVAGVNHLLQVNIINKQTQYVLPSQETTHDCYVTGTRFKQAVC